MTITSSTTNRAGPYVGDASNTSFSLASIKVLADADLTVVRRNSDDSETVLVLNTDYTVLRNADQETNPGGSITYPVSGTALAANEYLTILNEIDLTQPSDILNLGGFFPDVIEAMSDRNLMAAQQNAEANLRSIRFSKGSTDAQIASAILPPGGEGYLSIGTTGLLELAALSATTLSRSVIGDFMWPRSQLEIDNLPSTPPVDTGWPYGHAFRWGAQADSDSATTTQGTDDTAAIQLAVDSGHPVYIPEGDYSIEGTINIFSDGSVAGGKTFVMNSKARFERYGASTDPMIHVAGLQNYVNGQWAQLAARSGGGFDKGLFLLGQMPDAVDNTHASMMATERNTVKGFKILGKTANTGSDGSVGFYMESAARRRGQFIGNTTYFNHVSEISCIQWDYPHFFSTDVNANHFVSMNIISWGAAGYFINGALNIFSGCQIQTELAQGTTERFAWDFGLNNTGPEAQNGLTNGDAPSVAISGITKGATTTIDCASVHGLSTGSKVLIEAIVDNGPDGDLEDALNYSIWEVTVTDTDSFTIPYDSSGLTNIWSSGGTVKDSIYPSPCGSKNIINSWTETLYNASNRVVRLMGYHRPKGAYEQPEQFVRIFGLNVLNITGSITGGIGTGGSSLEAAIGNNIVNTIDLRKNLYVKEDHHNFWFRRLDDQSGSGFGTDEFKIFSGRMTDLAEATAYDVLTIDNVGQTNSGMLVKLSFIGKEATNNEVHAGEISWLCEINNDVEQTPTKFKDFQTPDDIGGTSWGITAAEGSDGTDTAKFVLQLTTGNPGGADTNDIIYTWKVELVTSNLEGVNIDWDDDITIQNGA